MVSFSRSYFSEDSMVQRIYGEKHVSALSGIRHLMLQSIQGLAYAGMDGGYFFDQPIQRAIDTARSMETIYFGTQEEADAVCEKVRNVHRHVRGVVQDHSGSIPDGTKYSATNANLQQWVIASLMDSALSVYEIYVASLSEDECDQFVREYSLVAKLFGAPDSHLFHTYAQLCTYMDEMYSTIGRQDRPPSQRLELTPQARAKVLSIVMDPNVSWIPVMRPYWHLIVRGVLSPQARSLYGLTWSSRDEVAFQSMVTSVQLAIKATRLVSPVARFSPLVFLNPLARAWIDYAKKGPMFYGTPRGSTLAERLTSM